MSYKTPRGRIPTACSGGNHGDVYVALGRAPARVEPLEVRFAHPVRLSPATHSQGHGRPCLQSRYPRPGFTEWGLLHVYVLTAGCGHASFLEVLIFNEL